MKLIARSIFILVVTITLNLAATPSPSAAEEKVELFLQKLLERGYYDTAVDYLNFLETSPLCPKEFKNRIPLEKAVILIEAARRLKDLKKHENYLGRAEVYLTDFTKTKPSPELFARAEKIRAQLYFERGQVYLNLASSDRKTEKEKQELRKKARSLLTAALDSLEKNRQFLQTQIQNVVDDPENRAAVAALKKTLHLEYVQVRTLLATSSESIADTFPNPSVERKKQFAVALKKHEANWEKYRSFTQGVNSALGAARCAYGVGDETKTITYCNEIFDLEDVAVFIPIKKQAAMIAKKIWETKDPLPFADVIKTLEPLINGLTTLEKRQSEWLELQILLAKAHRTRAEFFEKSDTKDKATRSKIDRSNKSAVRVARAVARVPGPTREIARNLLKTWKLKVGDVKPEEVTITTFEQARLRASDLMTDAESLRTIYLEVKKKVDAAGENATDELRTELDEAKQPLDETTNEALKILQLAVSFKSPETDREEFANVRYLQAYAYFILDKHYEAIVIGEHLTRAYPGTNSARSGASLALKSYLQLYISAPKDDNRFEYDNLKRLADDMIRKWPGQRATESAALIMARFSTRDGNIDAAEKYVNAIPKSSPGRVLEELRIGQIFWFQYLNRMKQNPADAAKHQALRAKAQTYLEAGMAQITKDQINEVSARATLSLTDLYLDLGESQKAAEQLENAKIAPLDLIKQKHPAASSPRFIRDTNKTAVRVYMAAMRNDQANATKWVGKAQGVLSSLKQSLIKQDPQKAEAKMRSIYVQLAKESRQQMERLTNVSQRKIFSDSLLTFLDAIQSETKDVATLLWTGQTLNALGVSLNESGEKAQARRLHKKAITAFEKAKKRGFGKGVDAERNELETERQIAVATLGIGEFDKAIEKFADILAKKAYIDIQMDAAKAYQLKGDALKSANAYAFAMMGGQRRKRPNRPPAKVIFGWNVLAKATINKPKQEARFYEILYNMCYCRLKWGQLKQKTVALTSARDEILKYAKKNPEMAGMRTKFQELLANIQKSLQEPVTKLPVPDPGK